MKFWLSLLSDIATELEGEGVKEVINSDSHKIIN